MSRLFRSFGKADDRRHIAKRHAELRRRLARRRQEVMAEVQAQIEASKPMPPVDPIADDVQKMIEVIDEVGVAHGYTEEDDNAHGD